MGSAENERETGSSLHLTGLRLMLADSRWSAFGPKRRNGHLSYLSAASLTRRKAAADIFI
jgi:hypothetical protein